jgi:cell division protein FtsW (lipid II flippase)
MNKVWKQLAIATNWPVLVAVLVLTGIGLVSIWAHSEADLRAGSDAKKQALFVLVGVGLMLAMQAVDYRVVGRFAWVFYFISLGLILYTVMPGVPQSGLFGVPAIKGQRNWINFGVLKLQPAELMKVAFVMVMARYLRFRSNYRTLGGLMAPFALAVVPLVLILRQPDLGTALVFIPALMAMLFVAGARMAHLGAVLGIGIVLAPMIWYAGPKEETGLGYDLPVLRHLPALVKKYQRDRLYAMSSDDPAILRGPGFQQHHAGIAFGSGAITGRGPLSIPTGRHVPEAHNDMIFALVGEQFGFVGALVLLGAYLVLFSAGIEISSATREPFGKLTAVGVVSLLAGQTFLNLMVTLKMMPVTGVTLPFVSYGGSSLIASFAAAGLLLNIGQNRPLVMAKDSFDFD